MDVFERLLKIFGRDYRQMSKKELYELARKYQLEGISNPGFVGRMSNIYYDFFLKNLKPESYNNVDVDRKKIIDQLEARDKFASSFISIVISVFALVISGVSILVAIFK